MFAPGTEGSPAWLLIIGAALLGCTLSPAAEMLIARSLPRLGGVPSVPARITTAALTGAACAAFAARFGITFALLPFIFLAVVGMQLARIDAAQHLLPNPLVLTLLMGGFLLLLTSSLLNKQTDDLVRASLSAVILFVFYLFLALISPGGIGMGDVKLAAPVGLYLGYLGWSQLMYGGLAGFILNGLVTLIAVSRNRRSQADEVPHGPSMLAATAGTALLFL